MSIELSDLMKTTPKQLASLQHDALKKHVLGVLNLITNIIRNEQYDSLMKDDDGLLEFSPAGDGYGNDNHYINFSYMKDEPMDIKEIVEELRNLKKIYNK